MKYINIPDNPEVLTYEKLIEFGFDDITKLSARKIDNYHQFCKSFTVGNSNEQQTFFVELGSKGWTFNHDRSPLYKFTYQLEIVYFIISGKELTEKP